MRGYLNRLPATDLNQKTATALVTTLMFTTKGLMAIAANALLMGQISVVRATSTADLVLMSTVDTSNNHVVNVLREDGGELRLIGSRTTDALENYDAQMLQYGSRTSFSSSGGLVSDGMKYVVAANTNNNSISLMTMEDNLSLVTNDVVSSEGAAPCSVAIQDDLVCALNCGGRETVESSVQCFEITADNKLNVIENMRADVVRNPNLTVSVPWRQAPSEIQFSTNGQTIIVAGKDISFQTWNVDMTTKDLTPVSVVKPYVDENGLSTRIYSFNQAGKYLIATGVVGDGNPARDLTYQYDETTGEVMEVPEFVLPEDYLDTCWSDYRDGFWYAISPDSGRQAAVESFIVAEDGTLTLAAVVNITRGDHSGGFPVFDGKISADGKFLYLSEYNIRNGRDWIQNALGSTAPLSDRTQPIGYSSVSIIELGPEGSMKYRGRSDSGELPLGVTGLTTMSVELSPTSWEV